MAVPALPVEITDDLGQKIVLTRPAGRIIPLYGAFAEMLFSIGAGDAVVARTQADVFPPGLAVLPSVGTHMNPNVEMILGLKPDMVIVSASRRQETPEITRLADSGIPVAVFSPKTFDQIFSVIERLGSISGHEQQASAFAANLAGRLGAVRDKLAGINTRPRVFLEIRAEPSQAPDAARSWMKFLKAAGAKTSCDSDKAIVQYSIEALFFLDPDFYIVQQGPMNKGPAPPGSAPISTGSNACVKAGS